MSLGYKKVLIIGASSGIGKALADKVVQSGSELIVSGRRQENLHDIVKKYGTDKVSAKAFDVTQLEQVRTPTPKHEMGSIDQIKTT
jgi:NADP-dependent 3-hydroxy acid dehydrogenase YdfG